MTAWSRWTSAGVASAILRPKFEHHDALGDVHHDLHVVLDEHERDVELVARGEDEGGHVLLLVDGHAGHRLVEQQQLRLLRQRAPELDALLQPVGEVVDALVAQVRDLQQREDLLGALALDDLVGDHVRQPQQPREHAAAAAQVAPGHDVLDHGQPAEQRRRLERARQPEPGDLVRRDLREVGVGEADVAGRRAGRGRTCS